MILCNPDAGSLHTELAAPSRQRLYEAKSLNYYEHHLGDYLKNTLHLSMLQEGAYRRLLDVYYSREQGIPKDQVYLVARATSRAEKLAVDYILESFFKLRGGVWIKERCDIEIARYRDKREKARLAGIASGNARRTDVPTDVQQTYERNGNPPTPVPIPQSLRKESETKNGLSRPENGLEALRTAIADPSVCKVIKESR